MVSMTVRVHWLRSTRTSYHACIWEKQYTRKVVRTEDFPFVVKDIRITHLVSTRSKKISRSCLVPSRSRSLCGEIWVNYGGKRGDHFPLARQARSARGGWWERAQSARAKCLQLSRVSLVSALALLACSVTKPHEGPWVGEGGRSHSPFQNSLLLMCALIPHPFDPYMTSILYLPHRTACFLEHLKVNWFSLFLFNGVAVTHQMNKTSAERNMFVSSVSFSWVDWHYTMFRYSVICRIIDY